MSRNYTGLGRYEQLFDQLDAAISRLESRCDKIERRVTNLPASKATYAHQACYDSRRVIRTRPTCWDPPSRTHGRRVEEIRAPPLLEPPPQYTPTPSQHLLLVQSRRSTYWDPPGQRQSRGIPTHDQPYGVNPYEQPRSPPDVYTGRQRDCQQPQRRNQHFTFPSSHTPPQPQLVLDQKPPPATAAPPPTIHLRQAEACLEPPTAVQQPLLQRPPSCWHPSSGTIDKETCFMDHEIDYLSDNEKGVGHGSISATGTLSTPTHAAESRCFSHLHLHHDPYISSPLAVATILPPQPGIFPSCSPVMINPLSSAPLHVVPPPQAAISPPCSPDMINIVVQRRGKSSMPKGEIKSILSNKRIIGRTASGNQPMITGFGCLRDTKMEQEKLNATDASIGFSYVMAETRDQFAIKYVYIGHEMVGYWGAKQQSRAFDPGGVA